MAKSAPFQRICGKEQTWRKAGIYSVLEVRHSYKIKLMIPLVVVDRDAVRAMRCIAKQNLRRSVIQGRI